jgi:hypothetical protein
MAPSQQRVANMNENVANKFDPFAILDDARMQRQINSITGGGGGGGTPTVIVAGATLGSPYDLLPSDVAVLFKKSIGSASYAVLPLAADMDSLDPVLFKDVNGDAATNNITFSFSGGELCDGQSEVIVDSNYGWVRLAPLPGGGAWYQA